MNIFSKLFKRNLENPKIPITSKAIDDYFLSSPSTSGVAVNKDTALGSAAVWRAVNLISSSIARLPCRVYKREGDNGRRKDENHAAYYLLNKRPNEYQTAYNFFQTLFGHTLLLGNAYAYIFRDESANPLELVLLDPSNTTPARENGRLLYLTKIGNEDRKLLPENVIHFKGLGYDGFVGYSVISVLRDTLGHDLALLKYGNTYFRHGSALNVIVEMPGSFKDQDAINRFRESWGNIHTGLDNAHRLAVLENGAKINRCIASNEEAQFLQSREFDLKAIANIFGLPPSYLGSNYNTSYASLESENKHFLNHSLGGWLAMAEAELEAKLLTEVQQRTDSHFIEYERKAFESGDLATTVSALVAQVNNGLLTINEGRAILNMPEVEGGDDIKGATKEEAKPEPQPQEPEQEPQQEEPQEDQAVSAYTNLAEGFLLAKSLTRALLHRLVTRMAKDPKPNVLERHLSVVKEAFMPFTNGEQVAIRWLTNLQMELAEVLPEQRQAIIENQDIEQLIGELWN